MNTIQCQCGGSFTQKNKSHHEKTKKHINYLKNRNPVEEIYNLIMGLNEEQQKQLYDRLDIKRNECKPEVKERKFTNHPLHQHIKKVNDELGIDFFQLRIDANSADDDQLQEKLEEYEDKECEHRCDFCDTDEGLQHSNDFISYLDSLGMIRYFALPKTFQTRSIGQDRIYEEILNELKVNEITEISEQMAYFEDKDNVKNFLNNITDERKRDWMGENIVSFLDLCKQQICKNKDNLNRYTDDVNRAIRDHPEYLIYS